MKTLHTRTGRAVVAGVLVLALGLVGGGAWALTRASASENLVLGTVTTGSISQTLAGSGTVETLTAQSVSFPVSAEVTSVSARVGDKVKAGGAGDDRSHRTGERPRGEGSAVAR